MVCGKMGSYIIQCDLKAISLLSKMYTEMHENVHIKFTKIV
jgi:hypothetical protein